MGQLGSKILHKIPYNMAWENNIFYNAPAWNAVVGSQLSAMLAKRVINFTIHRKKYLWTWKSSCSVSQHGVALLIYKAFISERYKAYSLDFYEKDQHSVEFFLKNAYNGKNPARPGKVFFFEMYNKIFCINCFAQKQLPPKVLNRSAPETTSLTITKKSFFESTQACTTSLKLYAWRPNWTKIRTQIKSKNPNNYKVLKFPALEYVGAKLFAGWLQTVHETAQESLKLFKNAPVSKFTYPRSPWLRYFSLFSRKISLKRLQRYAAIAHINVSNKNPRKKNLRRVKNGILKTKETLVKVPTHKFKTARKSRDAAIKKIYTRVETIKTVNLAEKKTTLRRKIDQTEIQDFKIIRPKRSVLRWIKFAQKTTLTNPATWLCAHRRVKKKFPSKRFYVRKKKTRREFLRTLTHDRAPAVFILRKTFNALHLKQLKRNRQPVKSVSYFF